MMMRSRVRSTLKRSCRVMTWRLGSTQQLSKVGSVVPCAVDDCVKLT